MIRTRGNGNVRRAARFPISDKPCRTRAGIRSIHVRARCMRIAIIREFRTFVDIGARFSIPCISSFARAFEVTRRIDAIGILRAIVETQRAFVFRERIAALPAAAAGTRCVTSSSSRIGAAPIAAAGRSLSTAAGGRNHHCENRDGKDGSRTVFHDVDPCSIRCSKWSRGIGEGISAPILSIFPRTPT